MTKLGHCNQLREEYTVGPKEAQQAWIKWRRSKNKKVGGYKSFSFSLVVFGLRVEK